MKKTCRDCGYEKDLDDDFYPHPRMADGHLNKCKDCVKRRVTRHREGNESVREYDRRRYRENPGRKARIVARQQENPERTRLIKNCLQIVQRAVAKGLLEKASECENCGRGDVPLEGAHHDYSKPLEVRWLCRRCHRRWDSKEPKLFPHTKPRRTFRRPAR